MCAHVNPALRATNWLARAEATGAHVRAALAKHHARALLHALTDWQMGSPPPTYASYAAGDAGVRRWRVVLAQEPSGASTSDATPRPTRILVQWIPDGDLEACEVALARAERAVIQLVDTIAEPALVVEDGVILRANSAAARLAECATPDAMTGQPLATFVPDAEHGLGAFEQRGEHDLLRTDGARVGRIVSVYRIAQSDGDPSSLALVFMTQPGPTTLLGLSTEPNADELTASLALGVTHQVATWLTSAYESISLATRSASGTERTRLASALADFERTSRMLRAYTSVVTSPRTPRPLDIAALLEMLLQITSPELEIDSEVERQVDCIPIVNARPDALAALVVHVLLAAARNVAPSTTANASIFVGITRETKSLARLRVAYSGSALDPATRDMLMRLGEAADTPVTCAPTDVSTDGTISILIDLPCTFASTHPTMAPAVEATAEPSRLARVLVIDDDLLAGRALRRILGPRYHVALCRSSEEGILTLQHDPNFDAVFCDLIMPGQTGMDFFSHLVRLRPELCSRVAFITGGAITPQSRAFLASSASTWFQKPLDAEAVREFVRRQRQERTERRD